MSSAILKGRTVERKNVLDAIEEFDHLGREEFLRRFGYGDARTWLLRHAGRSYPSKAIVGVAAGLAPSEFFGGARGAVQVLARLGFECRQVSTGQRASDELEDLRKLLEADGLDVRVPAWPAMPVTPTAYFASGSNRPSEIEALGYAGADVGVVATELSPAAVEALEELAGSDVLVFVDSGAFSEVSFDDDGEVRVVRPVTWESVFAIYRRLASSLGSQVFLVAPDRVGSQDETFARLRTWRDELVELRRLGANVLVPCQRGRLELAEFAEIVDEIFGVDWNDWIPALPCKKAATTPEEVRRFLLRRRPSHVHLLGLGIRNLQAGAFLAAFEDLETSVSLDSCWIAANVGRDRKTPRRLTRAREAAAKLLETWRSRVHVSTLALYSCLAGAV